MANKIKAGFDSTPVGTRHGKTGDVVLRTSVTPDMKSRLAFHAEDNDMTIKEIVNEALENYFRRTHAD